MTRSELLAYLSDAFASITDEIGLAVPTVYAYPLDIAFRRLGVTEANLPAAEVDASLSEAAQALGEYYSLRRFWQHVSTRIDYPADKIMTKRSQLFTQIGDLLEEAAKRATALGYDVSTASAYEFIRLNLDFLEPEATV